MSLRISYSSYQSSARYDPATDDLDLTERRWFAVRTSARHEKMAARELKRDGIEHYVPLRQKVCDYDSKKVTRELPLVTGYVFVFIRRDEELTVLRNFYVRSFVRLGAERRCVTPAEIELLRTLSTDRQLDWQTIEDVFTFEAGTPVEIISGPLAGVKGHYVSKKSKKTFIVALGSLNACLATCEVDPRMLMPLHGGSQAPPEDPAPETDDRKDLW